MELAYEADGPTDGHPVVAVHGWPDSADCWDGVLAELEGSGCRVYRPHLRGFAASRFRSADVLRSGQIGALCSDLRQFLELLDLRDVVLTGHDWGARAAYAVAALFPERVKGLVAMSVAYASAGPEVDITHEQAAAYWYQWFFATGYGRRALERDRRGLCRYLWRSWSPSWRFSDAEFERAAQAWDNPDWVAVTSHSYAQRWGEAPDDPNYREVETALASTPSISVPTVVLHGREDGATLVDATADQEHLFETEYTRIVLDDVGHFVPREAPAETAQIVSRVVQR